MLENIEKLKSDITELEEQKKAREAKTATRTARVTARIFLVGFFEPYMNGVCDTWGVSPEEALQILINDGSPLGKIAKDRPADLERLKNEPGVKEMFKAANKLGDVSDEWVKDKMIMLLEVMGKIRPSLANAIINTPGGQEWFYKSLIGLRDIIYGEPQLNI